MEERDGPKGHSDGNLDAPNAGDFEGVEKGLQLKGIWVASQRWEGILPYSFQKETEPCWNLDFSSARPISDVWPPEL